MEIVKTEQDWAPKDMDAFIDATLAEMMKDETLVLREADLERIAEWLRTVWLASRGEKWGEDYEDE